MRRTIASAVRWVLFALFFTLGVVGLVLPLVPQVPFFIAAFIAVAPESPWVRRKYFALRARFPGLLRPIERWRAKRRHGRQEALGALAPPAPPEPKDLPRPGEADPRRSLEVR